METLENLWGSWWLNEFRPCSDRPFYSWCNLFCHVTPWCGAAMQCACKCTFLVDYFMNPAPLIFYFEMAKDKMVSAMVTFLTVLSIYCDFPDCKSLSHWYMKLPAILFPYIILPTILIPRTSDNAGLSSPMTEIPKAVPCFPQNFKVFFTIYIHCNICAKGA